MKIKIAVISIILLFTAAACQNNSVKVDKSDIKTNKDSLSYAIGLELGQNVKRQKIDVDLNMLLAGMGSGYSDTTWALDGKQTKEIIVAYQRAQYAKRQIEKQKSGSVNLKKGEEFLAKNKTKKGVHVTKSGLQYEILKQGKGATPKVGAKVTVNYRGTLLNGKEFDSSYKRGKPATFGMNRVIKGWTEALKLMKSGSKWKVWIPSDLAYGANGSGNKIGPNETLVFEIELLKFENLKK